MLKSQNRSFLNAPAGSECWVGFCSVLRDARCRGHAGLAFTHPSPRTWMETSPPGKEEQPHGHVTSHLALRGVLQTEHCASLPA